MELLQNEPFNINEYCGTTVLTYFAEDAKTADAIFASLSAAGYNCVRNELSFHRVIKNLYISEVSELLATCGCYLLLIGEGFDDPKNRTLRNHLWYQVGKLQAIRREIVVPYAPHGTPVGFAQSPLGRCNVLLNEGDLLRTLSNSFRNTLAKNEFFEQNELNRYVGKRLDYRKMIIRFDIMREDFEEAMEEYAEETGEGLITEEGFEAVLRDGITCAAKLLSFGSENILNAQLMPYRGEMSPTPIDYPETFTCNRLYSRKLADDEVFAEYMFELVLPIHRLFGVNFKPFLRPHGGLTPEILEILFASNFVKGTDPHISRDRLYFSLNFPHAKAFAFDPALDIGEVADYLFPQ
ncbi:MAG: hypothetical protein E7609_06310 [Ruminococcaceae bacterium]|nr:hypothetical protein [Oscillospiraceae bacterium]